VVLAIVFTVLATLKMSVMMMMMIFTVYASTYFSDTFNLETLSFCADEHHDVYVCCRNPFVVKRLLFFIPTQTKKQQHLLFGT